MLIGGFSIRTEREENYHTTIPFSGMDNPQLKIDRSGVRRQLFPSSPHEDRTRRSNFRAHGSRYNTGRFKSESRKINRIAGRYQSDSERESDDMQWELADSGHSGVPDTPQDQFLKSPLDEPIGSLRANFIDTPPSKCIGTPPSKCIVTPPSKCIGTPPSKSLDSQNSKETYFPYSMPVDSQTQTTAYSQPSMVADLQHSKITDSQQRKVEDVCPKTQKSESNMDDLQGLINTPIRRPKLPSPSLQRKIKSHCNDEAIMALLHDFRSVCLERLLSDFELRTRDCVFPVHKIVLSARSPVFRTMFSGDLEQFSYMDIPDTDSRILKLMCIFLYGGTLEPDLNWKDTVKLYKLSERFQVQSLNLQCLAVLRSSVTMSNVCDIMRQVEDWPNNDEFKSIVLQFAVKHFEKISDFQQWKAFKNVHPKTANDIIQLVRCTKTGMRSRTL